MKSKINIELDLASPEQGGGATRSALDILGLDHSDRIGGFSFTEIRRRLDNPEDEGLDSEDDASDMAVDELANDEDVAMSANPDDAHLAALGDLVNTFVSIEVFEDVQMKDSGRSQGADLFLGTSGPVDVEGNSTSAERSRKRKGREDDDEAEREIKRHETGQDPDGSMEGMVTVTTGRSNDDSALGESPTGGEVFIPVDEVGGDVLGSVACVNPMYTS